MLKKWVDKEEKEIVGKASLRTDAIEELRNEINEIRNTVNKIISFLQQGCCYAQESNSIDVSPPSTTFTNI